MKKVFFIVLAAFVLFLAACEQNENIIKKRLGETNYATVTVAGSNQYGIVDYTTNAEILPQQYQNISYYDSGFFKTTDSTGVQLFDANGSLVIPTQNSIIAKVGYFEFSGLVKGMYIIQNGITISGDYESLALDAAKNISFVSKGMHGVINLKGDTIISGYPYLVYDGNHYNVAKNKNDKRPIIGKDGKANWSLAEANVLDKNGKQIKKLTAAQAKKIFEGK